MTAEMGLVEWLKDQLRIDENTAQVQDDHLDGLERPYNPMDPTDPSNVLRWIEATQRVIELHGEGFLAAPGSTVAPRACATCRRPGEYPCATVRLLAAVYESRPGWKEEWGAL